MTSSKMARTSPEAGIFVSISEIFSSMDEYHGMSVRVTGRILEHDYVRRQATLCEAEKRMNEVKARLKVDTRLVEPIPACQVVQFIGELDCINESGELVLKARVVRNVDGLDLTMFQKALNIRNQYLASRTQPA